jgi:PD-(D/E)XK nuclease superfamily
VQSVSRDAARPLKLAPSDLTFLWDECQRCFWLKIAGNFPRPRAPFPKIFSLLDAQTKTYFAGKRTDKIADGIKPGRVVFGDRWVRSSLIRVPGHANGVFIRGRFDTAIEFDDGTFGVVDFKTTDPKSSHIGLYARQLHACAFAAEDPAPGNLRLKPISQLGLLAIEPVAMTAVKGGVAYKGAPHWVEIPRDDAAFLDFLSTVLNVLEDPFPPDPNPRCLFCAYLMDGVLSLVMHADAEAAAR